MPFAYIFVIGSLLNIIGFPPDPNVPFYPFWLFFGFVVIFGSYLIFSADKPKRKILRIILAALYAIFIPPICFLSLILFACVVFNDCL